MEEPAPAAAVQQPVAAPAPADAPAPAVELNPTAPEQYVVKKGDTLWDIASVFLRDPWFWPEIWDVNQQVVNPHLIYPGDILTLYYSDGRPVLTRAARLSPTIRTQDLGLIEQQLPVQAIRQFLIRPRVVSEEELEAAPYIVGSEEEHLIYGSGDRVYVRRLENAPGNAFSVFRPGEELRDPRTNESLGFEAIMVGDVDIQNVGDPSTVTLARNVREALRGDRLLPQDNDHDQTFFPRSPDSEVDGSVVSLFNAISQVGQYQIAVVNLGERNGMEKGHVLAIHRAGRQIKDPFASATESSSVQLPDERTGVAMVFRTFEKVSYALIMSATRSIQKGDIIRRP